jgi:hypothetical protein
MIKNKTENKLVKTKLEDKTPKPVEKKEKS